MILVLCSVVGLGLGLRLGLELGLRCSYIIYWRYVVGGVVGGTYLVDGWKWVVGGRQISKVR